MELRLRNPQSSLNRKSWRCYGLFPIIRKGAEAQIIGEDLIMEKFWNGFWGRMTVRRLILLMGLLFLVFVIPAYGDEKVDIPAEDTTIQVKEIVISAGKVEQQQSKVTQKIDVITAKEIENQTLPNFNLSEIFLYTPGAFINTLSRNDANWGSYGGLGPKYNVYLLDGLPIDSFVDPMSLDQIYVDRAEVFRGPASIMYSNYMSMDFAGNEAPLAGISNFITREKISEPVTRIFLGGGSWNTFEAKVYHEGFKEDLHYFLGGTYIQSDYTNYGTNPSWLNMINNPGYLKGKVYFKTTYFIEPDKSKISLFGHHTTHDGDVGRPNRGFNHQYDLVNLSYENKLREDLTLNFKGGYRYYKRNWEEDNFPPNLSLREKDGVTQNIVPADLSVSYKHWGDSLLTAGTDFQYVTYTTYANTNGITATGNDMSALSSGLYLEEKLILGQWVLRAGGRYAYTGQYYDLISGVKPEISSKSWNRGLWSAGVRYNVLPNLAFYTNAGSSYIVPSGKSIGGTLNAADRGVPGRNGQLPNPGLQPESGIGTDLGGDYWVLKNLLLSARGFYTIVDDAIVENVLSQNPSQSQSVNAGQSRTLGTELGLTHYTNRYFTWFTNMTYMSTNVKNSVDPNQNNNNIPFVPKWLANLGFTANLPYDIYISPYLRFVGQYFDSTDKNNRRSFGNYAEFNMKLRAGLFKTRSCSGFLNLDLNNLTNRRYEMPWQFQNTGFNFLAKLELKI